MQSVAILCHIYYDRLWEEIKTYINKIKIKKYIYFNVINENLVNQITSAYPDAKITITENRGADIGGFFSSINQWLSDGCPGDLIIKCHTKGSDEWRRDLFEPIFNNFSTISKAFNVLQLGEVGCPRWLMSGGSYKYYGEFCSRFNLKTQPMTFIGGTTFCIRNEICKEFFTKYNPIELKQELELGKPGEPSRTHAWERLLGKAIIGNKVITNVNNCFYLANYNEELYLKLYEDVKIAIKNRRFESGLDHYISNGISEGRELSGKIFDEIYYLDNNPDVKNAVKRNEFKSGHDHYLKHGYNEERKFRFLEYPTTLET